MLETGATGPSAIVLNGGSSSGKSSLALALQSELPGSWLRLGIDDFIDALPPRLVGTGGFEVEADGAVTIGPAFTALEQQWQAGVGAMARHGAHLIIEDNFVSGVAAQKRWRKALEGVTTAWIGVRCTPVVAAEREARRGDRTAGMAARQALIVHEGIEYDFTVDTSNADPATLARSIAHRLAR